MGTPISAQIVKDVLLAILDESTGPEGELAGTAPTPEISLMLHQMKQRSMALASIGWSR